MDVAFCLVNICLCIVLYFGVLYTNVTRKLNLHLLTLAVQLSLCTERKLLLSKFTITATTSFKKRGKKTFSSNLQLIYNINNYYTVTINSGLIKKYPKLMEYLQTYNRLMTRQ